MKSDREVEPMPPAPQRCFLLGLGIALALGACGGRDDTAGRSGNDAGVETLPRPEVTSGSVTGMPDSPGPGQVGTPSLELPPDAAVASDGSDGLPPQEDGAGDGLSPPSTGAETAMGGEPTPEDAVAVVRDYYAAINAGSFGRAYALWSDGASGQTPQQFADGFADTTGVSVQIDAPGQMNAAAGSRYIEVPVSIEAKQRDGGVRRFVGAYVLRRAMVDGASAEQRQWRITSADIREVRP